jgi:hypothetical protein
VGHRPGDELVDRGGIRSAGIDVDSDPGRQGPSRDRRIQAKDPAVIRKDTDRDKILTAADAKEYGIIDTVLEYRKLSAQNA